jgi:hypothetical protein
MTDFTDDTAVAPPTNPIGKSALSGVLLRGSKTTSLTWADQKTMLPDLPTPWKTSTTMFTTPINLSSELIPVADDSSSIKHEAC